MIDFRQLLWGLQGLLLGSIYKGLTSPTFTFFLGYSFHLFSSSERLRRRKPKFEPVNC